MTEEQRKAIDNIMDWFDFDKVHKVMKTLKWSWVGTADNIPSMGEIRERARQLLIEAIEINSNVSTGGFYVTYNPYDNYLQLQFIVADWDTTI